MTAMAMAGLAVPAGAAYASEERLQKQGAYEGAGIVISPYHRLVSENPVVDGVNKEAWDLWEEAMAQALAEGEEIVTVINPKIEVDAQQAVTRATKVVSTNTVQFANGGLWINIHYYISAMYDVTSAGRITNFRNVTATITYGTHNPSIQVLGYTHTLIDNGRTLVAKVTLSVTVYVAGVAQSERWEATAYFSALGSGQLYELEMQGGLGRWWNSMT